MIVLVMGVEAAGKTTVGRALADELHWDFIEGDDFHSAANKEKMHRGEALTDADRAPWLAALHAEILKKKQQGVNAVLSASALREIYRQQLFAGFSADQFRIVYLYGSPELLSQRVGERVGHFASPSMLTSQLATLEPPQHAIEISIAQDVSQQVAEIRSKLELSAVK